MDNESNLGDGAQLLAYIIGLLLAIVIDAIVFGIIAAIPAASLVALGVMGKSAAMGFIGIFMFVATVRVLIVGIINEL